MYMYLHVLLGIMMAICRFDTNATFLPSHWMKTTRVNVSGNIRCQVRPLPMMEATCLQSVRDNTFTTQFLGFAPPSSWTSFVGTKTALDWFDLETHSENLTYGLDSCALSSLNLTAILQYPEG